MIMATRNEVKDRLIHNQSPFPTKDKVLSYTIPMDHAETLLFCSSSTASQDNTSLNFITTGNSQEDDDPCNGRDSLASFLDEGLGTSLDGVDEISSPIFPTLGRNDSGVFSSDEGAGVIKVESTTPTIPTSNHSTVISPSISSITTTFNGLSRDSSNVTSGTGVISVAEVVSWKGCTSSHSETTGLPPAAATISVITDSVTGIPSIVCTSVAANTIGNNFNTAPSQLKSEQRPVNFINEELVRSGNKSSLLQNQQPLIQQQRCKSMPLGRQGPQKCTICDKVFSNASALTKHKLTHSDERRHACATCGKAFKRQDHLNGHMLTHRNKKPFECKSKGCGKSYCDARSLRRHVENRHGHEVLESMNLTSNHNKHGNKNNHGKQNTINDCSNNEPPQQPELVSVPTVTFTPIKIELGDSYNKDVSGHESQKALDSMPILQAEQPPPRLQTERNLGKVSPVQQPPVLQKAGESSRPLSRGSTGVPIVIKRENVSVFDFDENVEDAPVAFTQEKIATPFPNPTIKVSNVIDTGKLGPLPDIRLIQEWTKRLGDSKVAVFLASSTGASQIAQLAGPMSSIQLEGQIPMTIPGTSHAFIPTNENGLFSVTPISLVPNSSGEVTFKSAAFSVPVSETPKSVYIVPTDPLLSTVPSSTISVSNALPVLSSIPSINVKAGTILPPVPKMNQQISQTLKESKLKNEKCKTGIGSSLANRIKTKLKAGSLKKLGKVGNVGKSISVGISNGTKEATKLGNAVCLPSSRIVINANCNGNGTVICEGKGTLAAQQIPTSGTSTITISAGSGISTWCDSPKEYQLNPVEDDRLSEGTDGEDKPVECSICCRRFKNTPALNGHMRLHGGYFKKETEGNKKKDQVSKEPAHSAPLQTASVSVRALIEEKIKERRNNLLKLAAAAAEKSSNEGPANETSIQCQVFANSVNSSDTKANKSEKSSEKVPKPSVTHQLCDTEAKTCPSPHSFAQQSKVLSENVKLKVESNSEKDRDCDQDTNIISTTNVTSSNTIISAVAGLDNDSSFQELSILIGDSNVVGGITDGTDELLPSIIREPASVRSSSNTLSIDKSNFALLDCGINPEDLCQAFHLIYVENNGTDLPITIDQTTIGKVSKMFQDTVPEFPILPSCTNDNLSVKDVVGPTECPIQEDPCNLHWEWRNSMSSDTDNSLSNVQDCVNSLLCSSSSETPDESSTKDPVAGGAFCYTPILSPNSTFCLTPCPDSPFEATGQTLSFICPSPSIENGSTFPDPSSLVNPPSVEALFASDLHSANTTNVSTNITPSPGLVHAAENGIPKYSQMLELPQENHTIYDNGRFDEIIQSKSGSFASQNPQQQAASIISSLDCFSSDGNFSTMVSTANISCNDFCKLDNSFGTPIVPTSHKDIIFHCPVINGLQQSYIPYEVFAPISLPRKVTMKWIAGGMEKCKNINVGPEYQADIPNIKGNNKGRNKAHKNNRTIDEKLWDPNILDICSNDEVDKYLEFACCSAVPGGGMNKEYALHLLMLSRGNIREALLRLMEKLPSLPQKIRSYSYLENHRWSSEEVMAFQIALVQAGKSFTRTSKSIGTKSRTECTGFYYFWKKVCPSEYQVMKQIWKDRLNHQLQLQSQNQRLINVSSKDTLQTQFSRNLSGA